VFECLETGGDLRDLPSPIEPPPAILIAIDAEQHSWLELPETFEHALDAEVGPQLAQVAPIAALASIATSASGTLGMYATTRGPARTPSARNRSARMRTWPPSSSQSITRSDSRSLMNIAAGAPGRSWRSACSA
jgi:hypothetical protein